MNNKLVTIPSSFSIKTVLGWSAEVGEDMGWTLDELMAYADSHPDAELFDNTSRSEIMQYLMSYNEEAFIDWSSGECHFDSDAFKRLLEFVGRFPEKAERSPEQASTPVKIRNGEVLLFEADIADFDWEYTYHIATQEEVDLVLDLIEAAKAVSSGDGSEVINIINEEAEAYYQGQKTVAEVVEIIQRSIMIYVNEN